MTSSHCRTDRPADVLVRYLMEKQRLLIREANHIRAALGLAPAVIDDRAPAPQQPSPDVGSKLT